MLLLTFAIIYATICNAIFVDFFVVNLDGRHIKYPGPIAERIICGSSIYHQEDIKAAIKRFYNIMMMKNKNPNDIRVIDLEFPKVFNPAQTDNTYPPNERFYELPIQVQGITRHRLIFDQNYLLHSAISKFVDNRLPENEQRPFYMQCTMESFRSQVV